MIHSISLFDQPGGLQTSTTTSGDQWDASFGWAPPQWIAVQALRRYGYEAEAEGISERFLSLAPQEHRKQGDIMEGFRLDQPSLHGSLRRLAGGRTQGIGWHAGIALTLEACLLSHTGSYGHDEVAQID